MASYPFLDDWLPCTEPKTVGKPGSNGRVVRIVVHTVGMPSNLQRVAAGSRAYWEKTARTTGLMISAHFTVERDGAIAQHIDTADAAYGTGWLTTGSVHIEHGGHGDRQPLTTDQLHASANLMAWLATAHPGIELKLTGKSATEWGNPELPGITTHRYIQLEYLRRYPKAKITAKSCPGKLVLAQLEDVVRMAKLYKAHPPGRGRLPANETFPAYPG